MKKTRKKNPLSIRNITRFGDFARHPPGWYGRIRWKKKTYSKYFRDDEYGGLNLSQLAAVAWRTETKKTIGMPDINRLCIGLGSSNTGHMGVTLSRDGLRLNISWSDYNGRPLHTSLSLKKHGGYDKTLKKARSIREKKENWRQNRNTLPKYKQKKFKTRDLKKYSEKELFEALFDMQKGLDRCPQARDFKHTKPKYNKFESVFGSWSAGIKAFQKAYDIQEVGENHDS